MQNIIASIFRIIFLFLTGFLFFGCASDPVPTYLPVGHPAHPESAEVVYTAAPNPFQDGMSINKMQPPAGSPETNTEMHRDRQSHHMKPNGKKNGKSAETEIEQSGHDHKEHE